MANTLRFLVLLVFGTFLALFATVSTPATPTYAQSCDASGSVDGTAEPSTVLPGQEIGFTATNFTPDEEVSFWFTLPDGSVFGTAAPLCCANGSGAVRFAPLALPEEFYDSPGRWALTVAGSSSQHTSVIYFCVMTEQAATATPVPATATTAPATATTAPTTATSMPATATMATSPTMAATSTTAVTSPTAAAASPTVEASPTGAATSMPATATMAATSAAQSPTAAASTPTTATLPATAVPATAMPTTAVAPTVGVQPTPRVIGMPVTGAGDGTGQFLFIGLAFAALALVAIGILARRSAPNSR